MALFLQESLTTSVKDFGSKAEISDAFIDKLYKSGLVDKALDLLFSADEKILSKTDGQKRSTLKGVLKLDDAAWAGGSKSSETTLILTEGDSAKTFAISGLSIVGRERFGVFPLRGKLLNPRDANSKQVLENAEFNNIKKILGLSQGKVYSSTRELRYSKVLILTDADVDGSHIKGLFINMIHCHWPSLLTDCDGFVTSMLTPIIKASKGKDTIAFYTLTEYNEWKAAANRDSFSIKYFKGLGTSTANEAKEYFRELHNSQVVYTAGGDLDNSIKLAFDKKKSDDRKKWLLDYDPSQILEQTEKLISVHDFIHKDLIHFSNHDLVRSIPSVLDSFKPSQRKVLFGSLKRNVIKECKVAQLTGIVSQVSGYHSGEASLQGTIIGMAQDFVGCGGINLLTPNGQFGTRLQGGKDAASPRYIFTQLSDITKIIFNDQDSALLKYLDDDGFPIEPQFYAPIIPMVLVNGANGIGTGFSTQVPCYSPIDIVENITRMLNDVLPVQMHPWYRGFTGSITQNDRNYVTHGKYHQIDDDTLCITELPIGRWTDDYKEFLENSLIDSSEKDAKAKKKMFLHSYENHSTEAKVKFMIKFPSGRLSKLLAEPEKLESDLRLTTSLSTTNMHLYSPAGAIKKYDSAEDIMRSYFDVRLKMYEDRRQHMLKVLRHELAVLANKSRFVTEIMDDKIVVYRKSKNDLEKLLEDNDYQKFAATASETSESFNYLTSMQISSFTQEKIDGLQAQIASKTEEVDILEATSDKQLWKNDLQIFREKYEENMKTYESANAEAEQPKVVASKKKGVKRKILTV